MRDSLSATGKDMATLERGMSRGLRKAFDGLIFDGKSLSDALENVAQSMVNTAYNAAPAHPNDCPPGTYLGQTTGFLAQIAASVFFRNLAGNAYTEATARGVFNPDTETLAPPAQYTWESSVCLDG